MDMSGNWKWMFPGHIVYISGMKALNSAVLCCKYIGRGHGIGLHACGHLVYIIGMKALTYSCNYIGQGHGIACGHCCQRLVGSL